MMDFDWTRKEKLLRKQVKGLFGSEEREAASAMESAGVGELREITLRFQRELGELGYWDLVLGPGDDGLPLGLLAADGELARPSTSLFLALQATRLYAALASRNPDAEFGAQVLEPLRRGELVGAVALSEVDEAPVVGKPGDDGSYVLHGKKPYVSNGPIADWLAVSARADGQAVLCFVRSDQEGLTRTERISTLGLKGLAVCGLELRGVRVPRTHALPPPEGEAALASLCRSHDLVLCFACVGLMQRSLEVSKAHARKHRRGGKPIIARQEIRFKMAEMLTLTRAADLLVRRAGWMGATRAPGADILVRCAKVFCSEKAEQVSSAAMQILAAQGFVSGNTIERAYRDVKGAAISGTTCEVARIAIADELLARY